MRRLISVEEVIASLPKDWQAAIEARGAELLAKVDKRMTLAELRKGRKLSQAKMAEALGIGQCRFRAWSNARTHACPRCSAP